MTSPSVYMIFDHLQAVSSTDLDMTCSKSTPLGATGDVSWLGGGAISLVGGPYTNAVVSLDPTSLTSLVRDIGPVNTASVVSEIAHGGPSYDYWVNAVQGTGLNYDYQRGYYSSVLAKPVDFYHLAVPEAEAYYMNINGAPGCNRMGDHPQCSTIFDGEYRAQLLVPEQVRSLRPEWADCYDPLFGALDPPIALTSADTIKEPIPTADAPIGLTPVDSIKLPEQTPATPGPTVISNPSPTTVSNTKPDDEKPTSNDMPSSDDKPTSGIKLPEQAPATPQQTVPSDPSPTAIPDTTPDDESGDKPTSDDTSSSNDTPSFNNDPLSSNNFASNDSPPSGDNPTFGENPSSDDNPDFDANSEHTGGSTSDSNGDSSKADGGSQTNTNSPDTPSNDDQGSSQSGDDGTQPQNALDVLSAAQQSEAAKETTLPGAGETDDPADGNSEGEESASGQQDEGGSNAAGSDSKNPPPTQVVDIDGTKHTVDAQDGAPVIDGTPVPTGGSPKTINGQVVSAVDGGIIVGTETIRLGSAQSAGLAASYKMILTAHGQTFTASPASSGGAVIIDGITIAVGQAAATLHGAIISAASGGLVVDGSTATYSDQTASFVDRQRMTFTANGQIFTASPASSGGAVVIDGTTIAVGQAAATLHGATISAASNGLVVDGSTMAYSDQTAVLADNHRLTFTADGQTFTASPTSNGGAIVVDGTTISVGHPAATLNGATISAASNGIVVDGSTMSYADASGSGRPAVLTLGSNIATASEVSSGVFAIGTVTLTAGQSGTTISGHIVSAASTGIVVDGASTSTDASGTQGTQGTSSGSQPDATSVTVSGAAKAYVIQWAVIVGCGLVLLL
jgi:putative intracellular protease/amidase